VRDDVTSCETSDEVRIRVFNQPQPDFSFTTVCDGSESLFEDASTHRPGAGEQIISREWDMNYDGANFSKDATLDNESSFNYTFPSAGTYRVALRVSTSPGNCTELIEKQVVVHPLPIASITPDRTSGCSDLEITFTNNSVTGQPGPIKDFIWEVNDGTTGFQVDAVQHPGDPGFSPAFVRIFSNTGVSDKTYQVRLRVVSAADCETVSAPVTITVFPAPRAGFNSLNYSPFNDNCSPVSVSFVVDDQTQALNPSEYIWTVADAGGTINETSSGSRPTHSYNFINSTQGMKDYFVTLQARFSSGCFGDSTRIIRVNPVPSSAFAIDTTLYSCERVVLNFDAVQKGLQRYEWTITSNGVTLLNSTTSGDRFEFEILRSPAVEQFVEIRLVTTNLANCKSTVTTRSLIIRRTDTMNTSFTVTPTSQTLPDATVQITNTTNAGPWTYLWNFGDGNTSSDPYVNTHTYATFGIYTITLTVQNQDCSETRSATVQVHPTTPVLEFEYDPASGCSPLTVNFTNRSKYADETTYYWEFGKDQGSSRAKNPSYTYYEPGIYTVTLSASNVLGEPVQVTKQLIIEVYEKPSAQFNVKPRQVSFPGGKLYTDNQTTGATSYLWHFGDGTTSTDFEPEHVYNAEGTFDVMLIAFNTEGCSDTTVFKAGVQTVRTGQILIPNAFSPNPSGPGNSGGQNDMFMPIMRGGVTEFQMVIFNRWGELLFETTSPDNGWDGYYKGKLCQQDVYVYKLTAKYSDGQTVTKVGDIHLIR
jgi:gliding motility-associated-like protein